MISWEWCWQNPRACSLVTIINQLYSSWNALLNCMRVSQVSPENNHTNLSSINRHIQFTAEITELRKRQTVLLILTIILVVLFVLVHGFHLFRWLRKKDYLSFKGVKHLKGSKNRSDQQQVEITVANPHTQSPKMRRKADLKVNSIYSVSGE